MSYFCSSSVEGQAGGGPRPSTATLSPEKDPSMVSEKVPFLWENQEPQGGFYIILLTCVAAIGGGEVPSNPPTA